MATSTKSTKKAPAKKSSTAKKSTVRKTTASKTETKKNAVKAQTVAVAEKKAPTKETKKSVYTTDVSVLLCMAIEALILLLGYLIIINA